MKPIYMVITIISSILHYLMFRPYSFMTAFKLYFMVIHIGVCSSIRGINHLFKKNDKIHLKSIYEKQVGFAHLSLGILGLLCLVMGNSFEYLCGIAIVMSVFHIGCGVLQGMESMNNTSSTNRKDDWLLHVLYNSIFVPCLTILMVYSTPSYYQTTFAPPSTLE